MPRSPRDEMRRTALGGLRDLEATRNARGEFLDMGDDADDASALLQLQQRLDGEVERLAIERAEALVDEHRIEADAARVALDDIGQPERERKRGEKRLAA